MDARRQRVHTALSAEGTRKKTAPNKAFPVRRATTSTPHLAAKPSSSRAVTTRRQQGRAVAECVVGTRLSKANLVTRIRMENVVYDGLATHRFGGLPEANARAVVEVGEHTDPNNQTMCVTLGCEPGTANPAVRSSKSVRWTFLFAWGGRFSRSRFQWRWMAASNRAALRRIQIARLVCRRARHVERAGLMDAVWTDRHQCRTSSAPFHGNAASF